MKKLTLLALTSFFIAASVGRAATITVTTAASSGAGSLDAAISALNDGDTIAFNITGTGPFYITPPAGGFALIKKNNITIDGYSAISTAVCCCHELERLAVAG